MAVVSVSLSDRMLKEIDALREEMGFAGRSEVVRAGLRTLIAENKEAKRLRGKVSSVLLAVHDRASEACVTEVKHEFEDVITTHIHNGLEGGACLEIFVLSGGAARVKGFLDASRPLPGMRYLKLVTP